MHEIANPEIRAINKELSVLRGTRRRMIEKIQKLVEAGKKTKRLVAFKRKRSGLTRRINNRLKKRESLPEKVNLFDRIKAHGIVRLTDEKKLFFDWLKMHAIWAKREMIEVVKPHYKDLRDVNKFVKSILNSRTYVRRRSGGVLHIDFPAQRSKRRALALARLCDRLNNHGELDLGLHCRRLVFGIRDEQ